MDSLYDFEPVAPLRITKVKTATKPALTRTESHTSDSSIASFSSFSSPSSPPSLCLSASSSSSSVLSIPSPNLSIARQVHRKRHESWQIAARLVTRAEDLFEECLWGGEDVEEAAIRLRIAREEEEKSRVKVDQAALDIMQLRRRESTDSQEPSVSPSEPASRATSFLSTTSSTRSSTSTSSTSSSSSNADSLSILPELQKHIKTEIMHAARTRFVKRRPTRKTHSTVPPVPPLPAFVHEGGTGAGSSNLKTNPCGCVGDCLCSTISSLFC